MSEKYLKFARFYPTISAMAIPAVVATAMFVESGSVSDSSWDMIVRLFSFAPIAGFFVVMGFWLTEISRFISLIIMEKTRFKMSGKTMPTTCILLGENKRMSESMRNVLSARLEQECNLSLPPKGALDDEARQRCIDITGYIRERTRDNAILSQYNHEFGFCRNFIGASVVADIILLILVIISYCCNISLVWAISGLFLQTIFIWFFWRALCISGDQYANHLFYSYLSKK